MLINSNKNMTLKKYKSIKLAVVIIVSIVASQAVIFKNYIFPIATMIIVSLLLIYLRGRVKGVLADERDYAIGGKSALLAIQIYAWIASISMFLFYSFRDFNPAFEPIGMVLAFSTCILMLLYAFIFRYYNQIRPQVLSVKNNYEK